jgi:two-component system response regulator AtoC
MLELQKSLSKFPLGENSIFSQNQKMREIIDCLPIVATSDTNVLILGESGTGKELVAKRIHALSSRCEGPFVAVNCAAVPQDILESEFFGHERGSFTGAVQSHRGLLQEAHGGILFLDEIGDMPLFLQSKILRVIQERRVRPVGGSKDVAVDFKLVAATHRDLPKEIRQGRFRQDLFYRLNVMPLSIPPLRERIEDIPTLIDFFSRIHCAKLGFSPIQFSNQAIEVLQNRLWPGNVRELENYIERTIILHRDKRKIGVEQLPTWEDLQSTEESSFRVMGNLPTLSDLTDQYIQHVYQQVQRHQGKAAEILGLSRRTLYRKLKVIT